MFKVLIYYGKNKVGEEEIHNFHQLEGVEKTAQENGHKISYFVNRVKVSGKKEFDLELAKTYLSAVSY